MARCTHLDFVKVTKLPAVSLGCDDSPHRHATAHAAASGHPLIRSIQPGEDWSWCFVDEVAMRISEVSGEPRIPPSPMGCP